MSLPIAVFVTISLGISAVCIAVRVAAFWRSLAVVPEPDPMDELAVWLLLVAAVTDLPAYCCDLHRPEGCCDPEDCGPCCPECETCPTLALDRWTRDTA